MKIGLAEAIQRGLNRINKVQNDNGLSLNYIHYSASNEAQLYMVAEDITNDIAYLVIPGSDDKYDWLTNFTVTTHSMRLFDSNFHKGFLDCASYIKIRQFINFSKIVGKVGRLKEKIKEWETLKVNFALL